MKKKLLILFVLSLFMFNLAGCTSSKDENTAQPVTQEKQIQAASEKPVQNEKENNPVKVSDNPNEQVNIADSTAAKQTSKETISNKVILTYSVKKPESSNPESKLSNLEIMFSSDSSNQAFKDNVENNLDKYIKISPAVKGKWSLRNGKYLSFAPQNEWKADIKYTVTIDKGAFNEYYEVPKTEISFNTNPFTFKIDSEKINGDYDSDKREYSLHIVFNYLFDQKQFKKEAKFYVEDKEVPVKITFDKDGYGALIKSPKMNLFSDKDIMLTFTLPRIKSADGSSTLQYEINHNYVLNKILEGKSFFIDDVRSVILKDENGSPRNVLVVAFSQPVNQSDVLRYSSLVYTRDDVDTVLDSNGENKGKNMPLIPINTGNSADLVYSFYVDIDKDKSIDSERALYLVIDKSLESVSGKPLNDDYYKRISFDKLPQTVQILQKGSLLSLKSKKMVTFETRGVAGLKLEVGKILPEQVQHIINFTESEGLGDVSFKNSYTMDATNFAVFKKANLPLASSDPVIPSYATIDLEKYLGGAPGLYYVKADGIDRNGDMIYKSSYSYDDYDDYYYDDEYEYDSDSSYVGISRFILVTDMYMIAKENNNNQVDVFVASISNGEPVKNAVVEVIAKNGLSIVSGETDKNGHFKYELSKSDDSRNNPIAITAKKGDDFTYLPFSYNRNIEYSKFDIDGEYVSSGDALKAMVFTDRGIYRPGETVYLASIIKDTAWKKDLSGVPVEIVVKSPKNEVVFNEKYSLDKSGFIDFDMATQSYFTTGMYDAVIYLLNNSGSRNSALGSVEFELKEFDTDTIRVAVNFDNQTSKGWMKNEHLIAKIKADNMFGTPAAQRRVKSEVSFTPSTYYFPELKGYRFIDPYIESSSNVRKPYSPELPDTQTDDKGQAEYNISELFQNFSRGTYLLEFSSEVFEKGSGDGVTGYKSIKVSPADYLVGYTTESYLHYLDLNEDAKVNFIAVDNNLNKIALENIKYRLMQVTYVNQLIKDNSGRYRYSTVKRYNVLNSGSLSISDKGTDISLPTNVNGDMVYEVVDKDNQAIGRVEYFVSGSQGIDTSLAKEAELSLKLDKAEYKAGDTINMNITAPYSGYGLITIEKEKVYAFKWFKADTNTIIETIKVPEDLEGNGYINVAFVRDISSKDIYSKPLSYAVMPFSIDKSKRTINITLKTPEIVLPGSTVDVEYSADKSGKIIVYGVDEGILQVAGYKLPDPLAFFMQKIALLVKTKQTADLILPDYKVLSEVSGIGGGEDAVMASMIAKRLNPFARAVEKPVAHWSHIIDVKAGDKNIEKIEIPAHFNGSMKVMAVAVSEEGVGSYETAFIARSPIVMTPNMPYAAVAGDKFQLSVGVTNLIEGKDNATIKVTAKPSKHLKITDETLKTVTIKNGGEALLLFNVEVLDELGSAEIVLEAESTDIKDIIKSKVTLSVRPAVPYRTNIQIGTFTSKSENIKVDKRDMYDFAVKREVAVSSNPLIAVSGIGNYLQNYPYGCTEQITSKIYPVVIFAATNGTINTKEVQDVFNAYINELTKRQKGSNGFTYWSGGSYVYDLPAIYATQLLIDARELGFNVPDTLYNNAINYIQSVADRKPHSYSGARDIAFAVYLLARVGTVNSRALNVLESYLDTVDNNWKSSLTASYIGAAYILYKNENKGYELLESSKPSYVKYLFWGDFYDSLTNISRYVYLAGRHAKDIIANDRGFINKILEEINGGYYNSFSSAFALAALYGVSADDKELPVYEEAGNGVTVDSSNKNKAVFSNDITKIKVSYDKSNKLGYYYYVTTSGFDKNIPKQTSNGIKITKKFLDKKGNEIKEGFQGDEVTVVLNIERNDSGNSYNVMTAFTDLVPGGTEILTKSGINASNNYESHEFREDRAIIYLNIPKYYRGSVSYKLKLLSSGTFTVPPVYAESLYNRDINATGNSFTFKINEAQ